MSHKTGKRVLTASTTLALAAVGLAAAPLTAHAAFSVGITEGCGTNDTFTAATTDAVTHYSINGAPAVALPAPLSTVSGTNTWSLAQLAGAYNTGASTVAGADPGENYSVELFNVNASVKSYAAGLVINRLCTIAENAAGLNPVAPTPGAPAGTNGTVKKADSPSAGQFRLYNVVGIKWVVTDNGVTKTYTSADFPAPGTADSPLVIATASKAVTVQAQAADANNVTTPNPLQAWTVITDGTTGVAAPVAPTLNAAATQVTGLTVGDYVWKKTDTTVTTAAGAAGGVTVTEPYTITASDRGKTLRFWALANNTFSFLPDASTAKYFDVAIPTQTAVNINTSEVLFQDNSGALSDAVQVPVKPGVKWYYRLNSAGETIADPTNVASPWTELAAGSSVTLPTASNGTGVVRLAAVQTSNTTVISKDGGSTARLQYFDSGTYTNKQVVAPASPSIVDGNGLADSYTFPAATTGIDYVVTFADGTNTLSMTAAQVAAKAGQTLARSSWTAAGTGGSAAPGPVDLNKDITITTTPSVNVAFTATLALSAGLVQAAKPWTQTVFAGTAITAPDPVFTDNAGVGAAENVKLTQTDGITFTVDYDTPANAANNTWGHSAAVSYTSGVANVSIPAGQAVRVTATAATGYILTNADATDPTQKTHIVTYNFTDGAFATPAAPTKADMPGSDNDTYTINGTTGVDYYVNGVKFDAAKFNLPQSTGGASSLTITAQAQSGFAIATGANTSWTLEYGSTVGTPTVDHDITSAAPPTAHVTWSADNAASYKVTYQKLLSNGQRGPELTWYADTDKTDANFVAMRGDEYFVRVVAMDADGNESEASETFIQFPGTEGLQDIKPGNGTFGGSWDYLTNLLAGHNLPYFGDTAALGYTNSSYTVTLPAGAKSFDLYATVHKYGAKGAILVNGVYWADFQTNSGYWGPVTDPYQYPVRTVSGWTANQVTIKVIVTENSANYVALDAYNAH